MRRRDALPRRTRIDSSPPDNRRYRRVLIRIFWVLTLLIAFILPCFPSNMPVTGRSIDLVDAPFRGNLAPTNANRYTFVTRFSFQPAPSRQPRDTAGRVLQSRRAGLLLCF